MDGRSSSEAHRAVSSRRELLRMPAKCHVCGYENVDGDEFCEECGVNIQADNPLTNGECPAEEGEVAAVEAQPMADGDQMACPACAHSLPADTNFCNKCGTPVQAASAGEGDGCPSCNGPIEPDDAFCNACGARLDSDGEQEVSPTAAPVISEAEAVFKLVVVTGHEKDKVFPSNKEDLSLGRGPENDIILDTDGYVSSRHTRVFKEGEEYFVEDLGSTNGTFLRVKSKSKIEAGDEIKIGQSIFRFEV